MESAAIRGLDEADAALRLASDGPNALPADPSSGLAFRLLRVLREPMFLLLLAATGLYAMLGDWREAMVLGASIVVVVAITILQERRSERALAALRDLSSPRALVIRSGREMRIPGIDVVRGDVLHLREGDRVAADGRLLECHDLELDESLLTGESLPVAKRAGAEGDPGRCFSGTLVVRGTALAEVTATGPRSELGRVGKLLAAAPVARTRLEQETGRLVRWFGTVAVVFCIAIAVLAAMAGDDLVAGVLAGLTLAIALLPEEFPVVLTVFLALGAWRIARHGVLTRRMPAVEMLGAATVLACDKTGTLTENRMAVARTWREGAWLGDTDARRGTLLEAAARASEPRPFDPMERALREAAPGAQGGLAVEKRYPLAEGFLAVAHGWRDAQGRRVAAMKGAPETVMALCALDAASHATARGALQDAASAGLRVLGVASADATAAWPEAPAALPWRFLGFVALADPLRAEVPEAVSTLRRAGIRVVMITGDHPETARAIASAAGIRAARVVTGAEIAACDAASLASIVRDSDIFARVRPEQKVALVAAMQDAGEVVAMTGDGVNDAPALRAADIGIAMGRRGTDVAREAAALVLLEDDFTAIVGTVRLGRRIDANLRNAMRYLMAVHVPLAGMAALPLAFGWPAFFFPVHVVFLEFVIDPACSIVFEAERGEHDAMDRPPRPPGERLFTARNVVVGLLLGLGVLVAVALVDGVALAAGRSPEEARALGFIALVAGNLALILANRSAARTTAQLLRRANPAMWWIFAAAAATLAVVVEVPAVAGIFRFSPPGPVDTLLAVAAGLASVAWYDGWKALRGQRAAAQPLDVRDPGPPPARRLPSDREQRRRGDQ